MKRVDIARGPEEQMQQRANLIRLRCAHAAAELGNSKLAKIALNRISHPVDSRTRRSILDRAEERVSK